MKLKNYILAAAFLAPTFLISHTADAAPYCREYTKRISVGGRLESGYGQACLQPDGDWLITEARGTVDPFDELYKRNPNVVLVSQEPVYFHYGRRDLRPVYYYPRHHNRHYHHPHHRSYYQPYNSGLSFIFNFDEDNHRRRGNAYDQWKHKDRNDRHHDRRRDRDGGRNGHRR